MSLRDDLKAYLDGELPPLRMAEVREAVDRDPDLARELRELRAISEAVKAHAHQFDPAGLDRTLKALNKRKVLDQRVTWPLGIALTGIFVAIIFPVFSRAKSTAKSAMYARNTEAPMAATKSLDAIIRDGESQGAASAEVSKSSVEERAKFQFGDQVKRLPEAKTPLAGLATKRSPEKRLSPNPAGQAPPLANFAVKAEADANPIVVVADSLEKAREKVAVLAPYFDGRVLSEKPVEGKLGEVAIVLELPVNKATEAVDVIKDVVSVPARSTEQRSEELAMRKGNDSEFMRAPGGAPTSSRNEATRDNNSSGFGGAAGGARGGSGGYGGGGFGGGGSFDANKASGGPPGPVTGAPKVVADARQLQKPRARGPVQKIVIVIRRRAKGTNDQPTGSPTPPLKPIKSPGNL